MRLILVHPAIGHRRGERYIRSWQMEPLPIAALAGLMPSDVDMRFFDDRMEKIDYDAPADAVLISVETYTARRVYQIASEFRQRGVPVIMGGFHVTLMPDEATRYAEAIVVGEAEGIWPALIDDLRHGTLQKRYACIERLPLAGLKVDRKIFAKKRYLPVRLIETARGCRFSCNFCAVQTVFGRSHRRRPPDEIVTELLSLRETTRVFFFVDDNFAGDIPAAKELLRTLIPLKLRWITQLSINVAYDDEFLDLLKRSGCMGVLIGFESLDEANLGAMGKAVNTMRKGYEEALANLRRHAIRIYATFVFGYENDRKESFDAALDFALRHRFYIAAFNHLTPFPGTALYHELALQGRLRFDTWWLDPDYRYNDLPFVPRYLAPEEVTALCVDTRRRFYGWSSILRRGIDHVNRSDSFMFRNFWPINIMHRGDVDHRNGYPLGDERWQGQLLEATR
jgi:Fe-S oxidoreductase